MSESASSAPTGAARWLCVHDELLQGLTHALSNRVGSISAVAYLLEMQPTSIAASAAALREEAERVEGLLQLMRLLPHRAGAAAEPVMPADTAAHAIALHAHHPDVRDLHTEVTREGDLQPAYADPAVLIMAVTLVLGAARRAINGIGRVELTIGSSADTVQFTARGRHADGMWGCADAEAANDVRAVIWLLAPFGGTGAVNTAGASVVIPTLQAARRAPRG